jgi:hypothetical protein
MTRMTAAHVTVEELTDLNSFVVILCEKQGGGGERLEFQRALTFDEQDVENGMDTYSVVISDGATHYGGVSSWRMTNQLLSLELEADASAELGSGRQLLVTLQLDGVSLSQLKAGLTRVFQMPPMPAAN